MKSNWFSKITPELLAGVSHKDPNKGSVSVDDGIPFPNYPLNAPVHTPLTTDVYGSVTSDVYGLKDKK